MRPLFFILGLVFAATVLIPNVDAIWCYFSLGKDEEKPWKGTCPSVYTECFKYDLEVGGKHRILRGCSAPDGCKGKGIQCCSADLCNGDDNGTYL